MEEWDIPRSEIEVGDKLGQGNYGAVFKGQLTVITMSPKIYAHKQEMDFEGRSHLTVAVKMLRRKWPGLDNFWLCSSQHPLACLHVYTCTDSCILRICEYGGP